MIKGLILISIYLFVAPFSFGQGFYNSLQIEADHTYDSSYDYIDVDSLDKVFFDSKNVRMIIDRTATYQILFSVGKSWEHHFGMDGPSTYRQYLAEENIKYLMDSTLRRPRNLKRHYDSRKTYTGAKLINETGIGIVMAFKDSVFTAFPSIYERTDEYNGRWTAFSNDKYLILRYVHSYPHGNQTSWYNEKLFYLKKIM